MQSLDNQTSTEDIDSAGIGITTEIALEIRVLRHSAEQQKQNIHETKARFMFDGRRKKRVLIKIIGE